MSKKKLSSSLLIVLPSGVRAAKRLAKALTRQFADFSSRYDRVSGGVMASLPGQKGHEDEKMGGSGLVC